MQTLVTGGAGFIGSHVVRALLSRGHAVRVLHLPGEDLRNLTGLDVERMPGDVTDAATAARAVAGRDWVFHLAAIYALWLPDPGKMHRVNVGGTRTVLAAAAAAGVARVVYTSSIAVFGGQGAGADATEDSPYALGATGDVYAQSKHDAHQVALAFAKAGLDVTIVAPCGPIGPGDVGPTPTGKLLLSAVNLPVPVVIDSEANLGDVRDMAEAHVLAAERGRRGESYLLGARNVAMRDLARVALAAAGLRRPVLRVPGALAERAAHAALYAARRTGRAPLVTPASVAIGRLGLRARCDKAARELGAPSRPLEDSVRDALAWWARNGYVRHERAKRHILNA